MIENRLIAITIIRNEENNYLREWLENTHKIADYHIFLDDASTDNTPEIIAEHLTKHPGELHRRKTSLFRENEPALRGQLWEFVRRVARDGDWILIVDADEFYDGHLIRLKSQLLSGLHSDIEVVKVSCLDMWNPREYRTDGYWSPRRSAPRLIRYHDVPFAARGTKLHMPPYPASTDLTKNLRVWIPNIHFAYLRDKDKIRRYEFYTSNVSADKDNAMYKHALSITATEIKTKSYFNFWRTILAFVCGDTLYFHAMKTAKKYVKQ